MTHGKIITILVTTPIDLMDDCYQLGAYANKLNSIYRPSGITIEIRLLQEDDPGIDLEAEGIEDADYFYVLMYRHDDEQAVDFFRRAYESYRANAKPKVYTYFKEVSEGMSIEQGVCDFMQIVDDEIGHFHSQFSSVDSIKLDMILELATDTGTTSSLDVRNGQLFSGKEELLDLGSVPSYFNNARLSALKNRKRELDRYSRALFARSLDEDSEELDSQMADTLQQRKTVMDEIDQIEHDTLDLALQLLSLTAGSGVMSKRILSAKRLFQQGRIDEARAVLEDDQIMRERSLRWERERAIQQEHERNKEEEQAFVNSRLLLISLLRAQGLTDHTDAEISAYYAECFASTRRFELDPTFLPHYVSHLYNTNDYDTFDSVSAEIVGYLAVQHATRGARYAHAYVLSASYRASGIMKQGFEGRASAQEAERLLRQVLPVAEEELRCGSVAAKTDYAVALSYLGLARLNQFDYDGSRPHLVKSVELGREIVAVDPTYRRPLAHTCNFLALSFYRAHECNDEAVRWSEESRSIREELYTEAPERWGHFYALGIYVLGAVLRRHGSYDHSEQAFRKAIEMLRELSLAAPGRSEPLLASALGGYAKLLMLEQRHQEAIGALEAAVEIRRRWYDRYPETYGRPLYFVLNRLAEALRQTGEAARASEVQRQARELDEATREHRDLPDSD